MATLGTGVIPSGDVGTELTQITRRAFVPKLIVQLYKSTPTLQALLDNAQSASGGVSSVTVPVQGTPFVNFEWSGYSGSFSQPATQRGVYNAEFNLKLGVVPVPFLGMEGLVQQDHEIIRLVEARMNDAGARTKEGLANAIFTNTSNTSQIIGLPAAADDATNVNIYGGLNRTTYTWWKGYYYNYSTAVDPTRDIVMTHINALVKTTGEAPNLGVCGYGTWTKLAQSFTPYERYQTTPGSDFEGGLHSGFRAISVAGVPIFPDPYCDEGRIYLLNTNYLSLYIHDAAAFNFTGFHSTIPNYQLGFIGALVIVAELVCAKPKVQGQIRGLNYVSI